MNNKPKKLPFTVVMLGMVSFFNDMASEMIYPIIPIFLTTVLHTSIPIVGFIEGFVEALASISKYIFGTYSDYLQKRKVFVTVGYSLAAISKILIGLAFGWAKGFCAPNIKSPMEPKEITFFFSGCVF